MTDPAMSAFDIITICTYCCSKVQKGQACCGEVHSEDHYAFFQNPNEFVFVSKITQEPCASPYEDTRVE